MKARALASLALFAAGCAVPHYTPGGDALGVHDPAREALLAELALPPAHRDTRSTSDHDASIEAPPPNRPTKSPENAPASAASAHAPNGPLELSEVLRAVIERYPPYLSVLLERDLASGRVQQALGAFDTVAAGKLGRNFSGYYEATFGQAMLEQPLASGGSVYGGYRISRGGLPDYYDARTQRGGEFAVGARLPLLRGLEIDARRFKLRQEEIDRELTNPKIASARIDFIYAATIAYYEWVAAGTRLRIVRDLLALAEGRVDGISKAVERKYLAAIDVIDNERAIQQRRIFVVRAERGLERAALALSLFLRDSSDDPIVPPEERLPEFFPAIDVPDRSLFRSDARMALRWRPELSEIRLLYDRAKNEEGLAQNDQLLNLDLIADASKNIDTQPYFDRNEWELFLGLEFKLPIQRREALGRLQQARTKLERLRIEAEFARDRVLYEIADALSALETSHAQLEETTRNTELSARMVDAERNAFERGRGDLLRINLREADLATAQILHLDAALDFFKAQATYRAALGIDARPEAPAP